MFYKALRERQNNDSYIIFQAEEIAKRRKKLNDLGINFLLNVGPDPLGRIPSLCAEELLKAFSIDLNHIK